MGKYTAGFGLSFVVTSLLSAALVVLKESQGVLKTLMKAISGHHWVTHGALILVLFVVLGFVFSKVRIEQKLKLDTRKMVIAVLGGAIVRGGIIGAFYVVHM